MASSAIFLALLGLALSFLPMEIAGYITPEPAKPILWILQLLGALYFAFAMVNWMAKGAAIGVIYNKPVAIGNFTHFTIGGLVLVKGIAGQVDVHPIFWVLTILYTMLAVSFGIILFGKGLP